VGSAWSKSPLAFRQRIPYDLVVTILHAEKMIGYPIEVLPAVPGSRMLTVATKICDGTAVMITDTTLKGALAVLVQTVLDLHKKLRLKQCDYRCEDCGGVKPLQVHHVKFRSQGGTHEPSNLRALCAGCHGKAHGLKVIA